MVSLACRLIDLFLNVKWIAGIKKIVRFHMKMRVSVLSWNGGRPTFLCWVLTTLVSETPFSGPWTPYFVRFPPKPLSPLGFSRIP